MAFIFVTLSTSVPNSEGRNLYKIRTMHTRQITYNTRRSSFGNSLEMGCVPFVCNIFHFAWKWVVFHFVCIYIWKSCIFIYLQEINHISQWYCRWKKNSQYTLCTIQHRFFELQKLQLNWSTSNIILERKYINGDLKTYLDMSHFLDCFDKIELVQHLWHSKSRDYHIDLLQCCNNALFVSNVPLSLPKIK
jgi:hypothetical protein